MMVMVGDRWCLDADRIQKFRILSPKIKNSFWAKIVSVYML